MTVNSTVVDGGERMQAGGAAEHLWMFFVARRELGDGRPRTLGITGLGKVQPEAKRDPAQAYTFEDDTGITIVKRAPRDCITKVSRDATDQKLQSHLAIRNLENQDFSSTIARVYYRE